VCSLIWYRVFFVPPSDLLLIVASILFSTMAHVHAFTQALIRCGFNQDTADSIWAEGFDDLDVLVQVKAEDIEDMIKNVRETRRAQGPAAQGNVTFTFMAVRRLKALQIWAKERIRTGRPLQPGLFAGAEMNNAVTQLARETMREEVHEDEDVDKPSELTDLNKWEIFWERFKFCMSRLRGAAKCPYTYVFREEADTMHGWLPLLYFKVIGLQSITNAFMMNSRI
jgi:hypothetical protein